MANKKSKTPCQERKQVIVGLLNHLHYLSRHASKEQEAEIEQWQFKLRQREQDLSEMDDGNLDQKVTTAGTRPVKIKLEPARV